MAETQDAATIDAGFLSYLQRRNGRRWYLDYVQPTDLLNDVTKTAARKVSLSIRDLLIRSFLAGGLLAYATSLVFIVLAQNVAPIVGAILFPVGFVIQVLLGLELATGNFALLPMGWAAGEVSFFGMLRNLGWVYLGNLSGSLFYAVLFILSGGDELRHERQRRGGRFDQSGGAEKDHSVHGYRAARMGDGLRQRSLMQLDGDAGSSASDGITFHNR